MALVVFLRASNAGGRNVFRPSLLVRELAHLEMINIGAAGTFVVRARTTAGAVRREILAKLPFVTDISVHPGDDVVEFVASEPFRGVRFRRDRRGWVAAMAGAPRKKPRLPVESPAGRQWSVRLEGIEGRFATGMWRPPRRGFVFPSNVVQEAFGVRATARWWETFVKIARVIAGPQSTA